ncbi:MAG: porin family protein [Candidatus Omnitrophota bacterium]|nr:porin family protein [Candidatus Omnitrophota bacterium]
MLFAQEEKDVGVVTQQLASERQVQQVAATAKKSQSLEKFEKITFEDVLKDPDNIDLNFRYAQQQIVDNNLLGAASTLERILIVNKDLPKARLFYAIVLFRLDNMNEAERELNLLDNVEMPDSLREEVKAFREKIQLRQKKVRIAIRETVGYQIDDNRNAAPSSKKRLFGNAPLDLTGTNKKRRDTSFINVTSVDMVRDLGFQAGHELFTNLTYFLQEQTMADDLDLSAHSYTVGFNLKHPLLNLSPSFTGSHMFLSRESFLRSQAFNLSAHRNFKGKLDVVSAFKIERQDYLPVTEAITVTQRNGDEKQWTLDAAYSLTPTTRISGGIGYANKHAKEDINAYERLSMRTAHTWLVGKGQFLINSLDVGFDNYDEIDTAIAGRRRRDKTLRYRMTYGAPVTFLLVGKLLPRPLKDITVTVTYEYYRSLSNITNFTYRNNKFQLLLLKKWEF